MRVFSGVRPSGALHLGNYLGAIQQWVQLQDEAEQMIVAVVDHHAITTNHTPDSLRHSTLETLRDYIAAGIDPDKSSLIVQSWIPEHTEMAWILEALSPLSWFEKVPTYKEKAATEETVTLGLLSYPALMAADILLYNSTHVPVGEDQIPHIELTNHIARRLNHHYDANLHEVEAFVPESGARIMSLQDPTAKMSKSGDEGIALGDDPDTIRNTIKKAVTDSDDDVRYDPKEKAGVSNLLTIAALLSGRSIDDVVADYADGSYGDFKEGVAEIVVEALAPIRERRNTLSDDDVLDIVRDGVERARPIAQKTLEELKERLGFQMP